MVGYCTKPFASPALATERLYKGSAKNSLEATLVGVTKQQRKKIKPMQLTFLEHHQPKYIAHVLQYIAKMEQQICVHCVKSQSVKNVAKNYVKLACRDD